MDGTPRRHSDAGGWLTAAERRSLEALAGGLAQDDPRLAGLFGRFGARGRVSRILGTIVFLVVSTAWLVAAAMITPVLALAFAGPVCVIVGALVSRVFGGSRRRR